MKPVDFHQGLTTGSPMDLLPYKLINEYTKTLLHATRHTTPIRVRGSYIHTHRISSSGVLVVGIVNASPT